MMGAASASPEIAAKVKSPLFPSTAFDRAAGQHHDGQAARPNFSANHQVERVMGLEVMVFRVARSDLARCPCEPSCGRERQDGRHRERWRGSFKAKSGVSTAAMMSRRGNMIADAARIAAATTSRSSLPVARDRRKRQRYGGRRRHSAEQSGDDHATLFAEQFVGEIADI